MPDPLEREVLRLRYMDSFGARLVPWIDVALSIYQDDGPASVQACHRLHERALANLQNVENV